MFNHRREQAAKTENVRTANGFETKVVTPFCQARARLMIGSLDDDKLTVAAHYNPAELNLKKQIGWETPASKGTPNKQTASKQDSHEYKGAPTRTLSLELLFDGYEDNESVEPIVRMLEQMTTVIDAESKKPERRRPHFCVVAWGRDIKPFRCVITSLAVKYTMFANDGRALRATCSVELTEARLRADHVDTRENARVMLSDSDDRSRAESLGELQRY